MTEAIIRCEPFMPPIPSTIRYTAWLDGLEELGSGYGMFPFDAIEDLIDVVELYPDVEEVIDYNGRLQIRYSGDR